MPVEQFCTAPGRNVLARGEFLVALEFPPPAKQSGSHYLRFIPRNEMDIAVVGCGAWLQLDADGQDDSGGPHRPGRRGADAAVRGRGLAVG